MFKSYKPTGRRQFGAKPYANRQSRFPRKQNKRRSTWSTYDLVQTVLEAKQQKTVVAANTEEMPTSRFDDLQLNPTLKANIKACGYVNTTPIQEQAIPVILQGKDIIGMANTGTGKTAAFLIPLINIVSADLKQKVLIVAPTRELAEQIEKEFRKLSYGMKIYSGLLIGGRGMQPQISALRRNPNFIIGTPGRIKDFINKKFLNLSIFTHVVLDETDIMVDIGFLPDIKLFISLLRKERQSLFFSATIAPKVQQVLQEFVKNPVTVSVKTHDTNQNIHQDIIKFSQSQSKVEVLHNLLVEHKCEKVLIFANTKWGVQKLTDELITRGFNADAIHGDKRQNQRHAILEKFKKNEIQILLATDVASRGLDIKGVSHVINFELPSSRDEYIHRIGRTGRADQKGVALTLIEESHR